MLVDYEFIAWKVSKYGVFPGPYFPVFVLNTEFSPNTGKYRPEETPYFDIFHAVIRITVRVGAWKNKE